MCISHWGGSRGSLWLKIRNTFIIFLVSGFWHGANWTFIAWGLLNAIYFLPLLLSGNNRKNIDIVAKGRLFPSFQEGIQMAVTFALAVFAWIFFRAENISGACLYISRILSSSLFTFPFFPQANRYMLTTLMLIAVFMAIEWMGREEEYAIATIGANRSPAYRWSFYLGIVFMIFLFLPVEASPFIYFQF